MNDMKYPLFIDFEASGFGEDSYPIEVAWNSAGGAVESYLINTDCIADWIYWDPDAECDAHQISQDHLERLGDPPSIVAQRMNERLAGQVIYSDAVEFDDFWMKRLFDAVDLKPAFKLGSAIDLFDLAVEEQAKIGPDTDHERRKRFDLVMDTYGKTAWDNVGFRPHRAGHDVKHLMETYRLLLEANGKLTQE